MSVFVLYGLLILVVGPSFMLGGNSKGRKMYGCNFKNDEYDLVSDEDFVPVFGDKIKPLILKGDDEFRKLKIQIEAINKLVLKENIYNSVDNILNFYETYSKSNKTDFNAFFKSYKVQFSKGSPASGLPISALEQIATSLKSKWPTISNHLFLGALQKDLYLSKNNYESLDKTFMTGIYGRNIKFTIPLLKFSLNGDIGYYLLDPTHALENPIALRENGHIPDAHLNAYNNAGQPLLYEIHANKSFITVKYTHYQDVDIVQLKQLIYVAEPYCSVKRLTEKVDLLSTDKFIEKRILNGDPAGGLLMRMIAGENEKETVDDVVDDLSEGRLTSEDTFPIEEVVVDNRGFDHVRKYFIELYVRKGKMDRYYIDPFQTLSPELLKNSSFEEVANLLGYTKNELFEKIKRASAMIQNRKFMENVVKKRDDLFSLNYHGGLVVASTPMTVH